MPSEAASPSLLDVDLQNIKMDKHGQQDTEDLENTLVTDEKTIEMTEEGVTGERENVTDAVAPKERAAESSSDVTKAKRIVSMHAIKCKCGNILSRRVEHCPECGKNVEVLLEELRQDFYRINFTHKNGK